MTTFKVGQTVSIPNDYMSCGHRFDPRKQRLFGWIEAIKPNGDVVLGGVDARSYFRSMSAEEAAETIRVESDCPHAFSFCTLTGLVIAEYGVLSVGWSPTTRGNVVPQSRPLIEPYDCVSESIEGSQAPWHVPVIDVRAGRVAAEHCNLVSDEVAHNYKVQAKAKDDARQRALEAEKRKRDFEKLACFDDDLVAEYLETRRKAKK